MGLIFGAMSLGVLRLYLVTLDLIEWVAWLALSRIIAQRGTAVVVNVIENEDGESYRKGYNSLSMNEMRLF